MRNFGHWEVDTVIGPQDGGKECLAVLVEKITRYYMIVKIPDKTAKSRKAAIITALSGKRVLSITFDDGSENVLHEEIAKSLNCKTYFCDAYCSGQKGLIEKQEQEIEAIFA